MTTPSVEVMFSIGTHVGPAVMRNRIRRRLRAVLRDVGEPLVGWTVQVSATSEAATIPYSTLLELTRGAVETLGRRRDMGGHR